MQTRPTIVLRYFDARGRAQFIRYYFRARGIPFTDERIPLSGDFAEWRAIRDDTAVTGPFKKLPVLRFDDRIVAETTVISEFLHAALGDAQRLSDEDNLRHRMLVSSLCVELMVPIGTLIWADRIYEGVDIDAAAQSSLTRLRRHLEVLDATLAGWGWFDRSGPETLADCLLWDQLMNASQVFGRHLGLASLESLSRFFGEFPARSECLKILESEPCQITGRPAESAALAAIRAGLDAGARAGD